MLMQMVHTVATVPKRLTCLITNYIVPSEINTVYNENDEGRGVPTFCLLPCSSPGTTELYQVEQSACR